VIPVLYRYRTASGNVFILKRHFFLIVRKKAVSKAPVVFLGIIFLFAIMLFGVIIMAVLFPAQLQGMLNGISNSAYHATGGLVGSPPPKTPPVTMRVAEQFLYNNGAIGLGYTSQPLYTAVDTYFGDDKAFALVYALNVTNNENVPIVKVAYYNPAGDNYPLLSPWYTNQTPVNMSMVGPVVYWAFANVTIPAHSTVVVYNANGFGESCPVYFYFANGTVYKTYPPPHILAVA
jgi:hypothetical protein